MTLRNPQPDRLADPDDLAPRDANDEAVALAVPAVATETEGPRASGLDATVAVRGAAWTVIGFGVKFVLRFGFNLLLTRLVAPRVFGVMALVYLFIQSLHMFSDLGIQQCVVHHRRGDDRDFLDTAWTLQAFRGLLLWIFSAALAVPAAAFYEEPALRWLIPLAGTIAMLDGLYSTAIFTLNRRVVRGRLVVLDLVSYTASMLGVIAAIWYIGRHTAWTDPAVQTSQMYAFAVGGVVAGLIYLAGSHRLLPGHRPRFHYEPAAARDLLHFGGWVFVSTACTFLASQADRLVIGKLSLDVLGVYQLGAQLALLPALLLAALCGQLVFPLYSKLLNAGGDARPAMASAHRRLGVLAGAMASGLIATGPTLVECLYPDRYHDAGRYVQLLAVAAWFTMLLSSGEAVLLARGQTRLLALGQIVKLLALPGLLYFGYVWGELIGLVIGFVLAEVLRYGLVVAVVARLGVPLYRTDLWLTLLVAGSAALVLGVGPELWGGLSPWGRLACASAVLLTIWGLVGWRVGIAIRRPQSAIR